jgi:hypothetical protein
MHTNIKMVLRQKIFKVFIWGVFQGRKGFKIIYKEVYSWF